MLVIELNEFNPNYLKDKAKKLKLTNIQYFLNLEHSETFTNETIEHQGLDPWVQWVSIHSGKPLKDHQIKRLGDTKNQKNDQIWNTISKINSTSCGVWGVMNAPCGSKNGIAFFVPDPWSFEEIAHPKDLENFLALPRYFAKNYLSPNIFQTIINLKTSFGFVIKNFDHKIIIKSFNVFIKGLLITGINKHSLATILDYVSCLYFIKFKKQYLTEFSLIFLNHIAHLQHNFWDSKNKTSTQMLFGLIICDKILGELKKSTFSKEPIILLNALKQKNVANKGNFVYRQKNPFDFFREICPIECIVEQNMTNDGILLFENYLEANEAEEILKNITLKINKSRLLFVERLTKTKLFYQILINEKINKKEKIIISNKEINFYEYIELVTERTGAHIPNGDIFTKNLSFPKKLNNHQISNYLIDYFKKKCI